MPPAGTSRPRGRCSAGCWRCWCSIGAGSCRWTRRSMRCGRRGRRGIRWRPCRTTCSGFVVVCRSMPSSRRAPATGLAASRIDLDADRLAAALAAPEADAAVLATIDAVLERWQGPAYPELDDVDDGRAEAVRLDELRVRAVERAGRVAARGRRHRRAGRRARPALVDEEPLRRAAAGAADGGAGAGRPHTPRRCGSTTTSGGCSATSWASSRRRRWPPSMPICSRARTWGTRGCRRPGCRCR